MAHTPGLGLPLLSRRFFVMNRCYGSWHTLNLHNQEQLETIHPALLIDSEEVGPISLVNSGQNALDLAEI